MPRTIAQARSMVASAPVPWLAHGMGRSYGDVAQNAGGWLIDTKKLDRFLSFDRETGFLEAEAGVTLEDVIRVVLPHGWFLPTTPGTKFVTLGGAVANDVHGKNHHRSGTFGRWVRALELARSDGSVTECGADKNVELFRATVGGLGLTGLITKVTLQLVRVPSAYLDSEELTFGGLDEFFALAEQSDAETWEHTVAWMDCVGQNSGRGIFARANWSDKKGYDARLDGMKMAVPAELPEFLLNSVTTKIFNEMIYRVKSLRAGRSLQHFDRCFYPLDSVRQWNLLYGKRGFYQYQCVIPKAVQRDAMVELLKAISASGLASFLVVIKVFGDHKPSPGYLSFPMPGTNLALDFPNRGEKVQRLFERMDKIVAEAKGRIYPAKDARMPANLFRMGYPEWTKVAALKDPGVHSDLWSRVAE